MADASSKPVIFISYAHADEPDKPTEGEVQWLSFVRRYLQPAVRDGVFDLWVDRQMMGGADWDPEIEQKLRDCDIFILLVSANSMASKYIVDKEIAIIRERQTNGHDVYFYPLLLTPTPDAGLNKVKDKNLRPRDAKPFSSFSYHDRLQHMTDAANEIAQIAQQIVARKGISLLAAPLARPSYVHISNLPETAYERLVGREAELRRLDEAWTHSTTNILSLIAEGGAGKSALVNEWLNLLQMDNYRGAEAVLGWSFYSQGSKERATAADEFLNWILDKLAIKLETTSASAKGEAIAEAMMQRRVLMVLDGVEPLQHGLDTQLGQLKDQGLRALLRRFAATPPSQAHGLIVLTSRLAVKDIARWQNSTAPVVDVERLSDEAGAALLRDNGVWGTDRELKIGAHDFGGHPLALGLLASFLKETQTGDMRRRDRIRAYLADLDNPRHDHAKRVMESYEKQWLVGQPMLLTIMHMMGLFNRPASRDCLKALRAKPAIDQLTDHIVELDDGGWQRAIARLREVRLLAPADPTASDTLDAHPLVREWFGEQLKQSNEVAWKAAHSRLYEHLRDTTHEGNEPKLEQLAPLYQAIAHGCQAGRWQETIVTIYENRICRHRTNGEIKFYAAMELGAFGSDLAALTWFFEPPFEAPVATLSPAYQSWVLGMAGICLRSTGRLTDAVPLSRAALSGNESLQKWEQAAVSATNLSETLLAVGEISAAIEVAERAVAHAKRSGDRFSILVRHTTLAEAMHAAGEAARAERLFTRAEKQQKKFSPSFPILYSFRGYQYCNLLLSRRNWIEVRNRSAQIIAQEARFQVSLLDRGFARISMGRSEIGFALQSISDKEQSQARIARIRDARRHLDDGIAYLQAGTSFVHLPIGFLARAAFRRSVGDWNGATRDLDEVEEIAEPGPMRLVLCDLALERARLAFARVKAFAPLNGMGDEGMPKPGPPSEAERKSWHDEAKKHLNIAADCINTCGYHGRDKELAELQAVLHGGHTFASLLPRV